ncbi:hypothetical protein PDIG_69390 [Penicillium digitatum PHI26]|uniref:Uncharacterized protein n=2 Tax=Penicillium digitatum TaxID=36651 RepID=K9FG15_PEND2|nr:hypothetical protein PDIP_78680 [Penicillium digitatum Pd1]EKV06561.1 hypothetical protein PDIP_78680 [Penicillium digitatum Pd1]EKV08174.1 hypothetical protein PDIG_69390 [Penicillium digitatum PHI26]
MQPTLSSYTLAQPIGRNSLISAKPWLPRLIQTPIMDTITMSPILIDTVECLGHSENSIIRLNPQPRVIVYRSLGLCATLLLHLYDICECGYSLKIESPSAGSESYSAIHG